MLSETLPRLFLITAVPPNLFDPGNVRLATLTRVLTGMTSWLRSMRRFSTFPSVPVNSMISSSTSSIVSNIVCLCFRLDPGVVILLSLSSCAASAKSVEGEEPADGLRWSDSASSSALSLAVDSSIRCFLAQRPSSWLPLASASVLPSAGTGVSSSCDDGADDSDRKLKSLPVAGTEGFFSGGESAVL